MILQIFLDKFKESAIKIDEVMNLKLKKIVEILKCEKNY